jgi:hypothetical protein
MARIVNPALRPVLPARALALGPRPGRRRCRAGRCFGKVGAAAGAGACRARAALAASRAGNRPARLPAPTACLLRGHASRVTPRMASCARADASRIKRLRVRAGEAPQPLAQWFSCRLATRCSAASRMASCGHCLRVGIGDRGARPCRRGARAGRPGPRGCRGRGRSRTPVRRCSAWTCRSDAEQCAGRGRPHPGRLFWRARFSISRYAAIRTRPRSRGATQASASSRRLLGGESRSPVSHGDIAGWMARLAATAIAPARPRPVAASAGSRCMPPASPAARCCGPARARMRLHAASA